MASILQEKPVDAPSAGQLNQIKSLPDNKDAVWASELYTVPVSNYTDQDRYSAEQAQIFQKHAMPLGPSAMVAENRSFVCRKFYGRDIILTRDAEGKVHALLNVCRHRASQLVQEGESGKTGRLLCPFHAWSYDLTGKLLAIPRKEAFDGIEKGDFNLTELPCREAGGLIWAQMDFRLAEDWSNLQPELIGDLDALGLRNMHLYARRVHDVKANWKLVMDTFQEGYHVVRLHAKSLGGKFEDTIPTVQLLGPHMRRTSGRIDFVQESIAGNEESLAKLRKLVTIVYNIFPSSVLICSQHYINLLVMEPVAADRTTVTNYMLVKAPPKDELEESRFQRSLTLVDEVTFPEDFSAAEFSQVGIASGSIEEFTLCSLERYVWEFHQIVDGFLKSPVETGEADAASNETAA